MLSLILMMRSTKAIRTMDSVLQQTTIRPLFILQQYFKTTLFNILHPIINTIKLKL